MNEKIALVIDALNKNNMSAIFCEKIEEIVPIVKEMLFDGCTITAGGSMSLKESGVWNLINSPEYKFLDRSRSGITPEEQLEAYKAAIGCDFFFCSTNALTENGELVNVDGFCNRISSIAFGPKKVVMVVGANKIVKDINEGFLRIKREVAPKNCIRLGIDSPCAKLGHCVSLEKNDNPNMTDGCDKSCRICCSYLVNAQQRIKDRITIILCNENLGF